MIVKCAVVLIIQMFSVLYYIVINDVIDIDLLEMLFMFFFVVGPDSSLRHHAGKAGRTLNDFPTVFVSPSCAACIPMMFCDGVL